MSSEASCWRSQARYLIMCRSSSSRNSGIIESERPFQADNAPPAIELSNVRHDSKLRNECQETDDH
jgi:hypothetical protein